MKKQLLVIATLDTKGREAAYVRDSAAERGVHPVLMDIGVLGVPQTRPDIANRELAEAAGHDLEDLIKARDRAKALEAIQEGGWTGSSGWEAGRGPPWCRTSCAASLSAFPRS